MEQEKERAQIISIGLQRVEERKGILQLVGERGQLVEERMQGKREKEQIFSPLLRIPEMHFPLP